MTRLTCCMSSAMGASRLAALGAGVAVDDMVAIWGNAANYKANRAISAPRGRDVRLFWPFGLCSGCGVRARRASGMSGPAARDAPSIDFDRAANSMYNHGFPRMVRRKNESRIKE